MKINRDKKVFITGCVGRLGKYDMLTCQASPRMSERASKFITGLNINLAALTDLEH